MPFRQIYVKPDISGSRKAARMHTSECTCARINAAAENILASGHGRPINANPATLSPRSGQSREEIAATRQYSA